MNDDNSERKEVELLIETLSSPPRKPAAAQPGTQAADPPASKAKTFISAINLPPLPAVASSSKARRFAMPALPQWPALNLPRLSRLPRFESMRGFTTPRTTTVVWMCVGLGVLLALAMPYWPYPKACTWWLFLYLFAVAMVLVAGIWAARMTWMTRLGVAHVVALCVIMWGITLAAEETLPRIGYAKSEAVWFCP